MTPPRADPRRLRLFTPGPLSTSSTVRTAMAEDLGSRTPAFAELTRQVRAELESIAECGPGHVAVPVQGSGTFAVEAMLSSFVGEDDHVLIVENGLYSSRMVEIARAHRMRHTVLALDHHVAADVCEIERFVERRGPFTHLAAVHFETGLGVLNDVGILAQLAVRGRSKLLLDAISTFGALALPFDAAGVAAVALSANKCLHGVAGVAFVIAPKGELAEPAPARTLSLDLRGQWRHLERTGEWRFTPPIQVLLGLGQALREYRAAGGRDARYRRYERLTGRLVDGLATLGIQPVIDARWRAPMITTFAFPPDHAIQAAELHDRLLDRDLVIYPGKHTSTSFRIGCMGALEADDIDELVAAIRAVMDAPRAGSTPP